MQIVMNGCVQSGLLAVAKQVLSTKQQTACHPQQTEHCTGHGMVTNSGTAGYI
jgi:hypothetical protein